MKYQMEPVTFMWFISTYLAPPLTPGGSINAMDGQIFSLVYTFLSLQYIKWYI